jgi:iron complex outermembrane receptor protein
MIMFLSVFDAAAQENKSTPLTELTIEKLLDIEVYSASKFAQKTTEAPASVTIVTANDIKRYGYRTLADILRSVRGMFVTYDRNYSYLGVRGFNRPGDYNARVLLLLDGYRLNDTVYDTATIGQELPLDMDLIDRVEVVRGPGSSLYGSNAVFGVVNVITKRGRDVGGAEVSGEAGSFNSVKGRATYGQQWDNGAELMLSVTNFDSAGQNLYFPEFDDPASNNGIAHDKDQEQAKRFFAKIAHGGLSLTGVLSERIKEVPTALAETVFNDPRTETTDSETVLDLAYYSRLDKQRELTARVYYGAYYYVGVYPYEAPPVIVNKDKSWAEWRGLEARLVGRQSGHTLMVGAEYQDNYRQDLKNYDLDPATVYLDDKRSSERWGLYVQDETSLRAGLLINAGLRYDRYSTVGNTVNPRLALIYNPQPETALKFLYGTAFRAPNNFELYYAFPDFFKANPNLDPEEITSYEVVVERQVQPNFRLIATVYRNNIHNLINQIVDPADDLLVFRNIGKVQSNGAELEADRALTDGARLRASFAWQITRDQDSGDELINSPRRQAKLNYTAPLFANVLWAGAEVQYTDSRKTLAGNTTGAYTIVNLTLSGLQLAKGLEISASVYNLLDRQYADPARPEHTQDEIVQDGRSYRLKADYRY